MAITYDAPSNTITVTGYSAVTPCTLTDIYNADVSGGWGVVECLGSYFRLSAFLYFGDGSTATYFKETNKFLETVNPYSIYLNGSDVYVQFGNLVNDVGVDGCALLHTSGATGLFRSAGGYPNLLLYGTMVNSKSSSDYIIYSANINLVAQDILSTKYGRFQVNRPQDLYHCTIDNVFVQAVPVRLENVRVTGRLTLRNASGSLIENVVAPELYIWFPHPNSTVYYIRNCEFEIETWNIYNDDRGATAHFQSTFDLHVQDANGDAIAGAIAAMTDINGDEVFSVETDENGDIESQPVTYRIKSLIVNPPVDTDVTYTPHTVTISASGYATRTLIYEMDRKREEIEMLDAAPATVPDAPSALTATAASQTQIDLAWTDNSDDETGFRIERSLNGTSLWTHIATVDAEAESYSDTGLSCGTEYFYRVCAVNAVGNSDYTDVDSATTTACTVPVVLLELQSWIP